MLDPDPLHLKHYRTVQESPPPYLGPKGGDQRLSVRLSDLEATLCIVLLGCGGGRRRGL
jgi:hypothetical protein